MRWRSGTSRPPAETHLDILHAQDVPAVVHVLLQVFVLGERNNNTQTHRHTHRNRVRRVERTQGHQQSNCPAPVFWSSAMNNNYVHRFNFSVSVRTTGESRGGRGEGCLVLTRYSKTSVSDLSVWTMSCSVTMLACFRSFRRETGGGGEETRRRLRRSARLPV